MNLAAPALRGILLIFLTSLLFSCETKKEQESEFVDQQNKFLLSLELVESAGKALQAPEVSQMEIDAALSKMDEGVKLAFEVKSEFLKQLDIRLPKLYSEMFILGVQNYRLGVESSDRAKQLEGLGLLSQWSKFWLSEKSEIQEKLINSVSS